MSDSGSAQAMNARRLINQLFKLDQLLSSRQSPGVSKRVVPAPEDNGEHKAAQRRLVGICTKVQPVARDKPAWSEDVGEIVVPVDEGESGQDRVLAAQGSPIQSDSPALSEAMQREVTNLLAGNDHEDTPIFVSSSTESRSGASESKYRRESLSLETVANWETLTIPYERTKPGRAAGTEVVQVEGHFPMSFTKAAVSRIWELIDDLNLGLPVNSRPFHDY